MKKKGKQINNKGDNFLSFEYIEELYAKLQKVINVAIPTKPFGKLISREISKSQFAIGENKKYVPLS
jgi:hypothetical protein